MKNPKILLTFGSDHSMPNDLNKTWVNYLSEQLPFEQVHHFAEPNVGNDKIARQVILQVSEFCKTYEREELLVGIMWERMSNIPEYCNDKIMSTIVNLEHYLRVQWFFEIAGIKYFMTGSHMSASTSEKDNIMNDPYVHLYHHGLDFAFWIPCNSMYYWCMGKKMIDLSDPTKNMSTECHSDFTRVIIEHLKNLDMVTSE